MAEQRTRTTHSRSGTARQEDARILPDERDDAGLGEAHRRYGGIDLAATLIGMLAALALLVLIGGLVGAAIGAVGYQTGLKGHHVSLSAAGLIGGLVVLFVSFLIGGWAAARIARYDGARNGLMTAVWAVVLAAILAGLGAWLGTEYNVFRNAPNLPDWFSHDAETWGAVASAIAAVIAMLVGGTLGGIWGARYHRRIDSLIANTRPGGITDPVVRTVRAP